MCNLRQYYICYENIMLQKYVQNAVKLHIVTTVYIKDVCLKPDFFLQQEVPPLVAKRIAKI